MYLDVEGHVTLNAMHRADIYREVVGAYRVRQPWVEPVRAAPVWPLRRPLQAVRAALVGLQSRAPMKQPS